MNPGSLDELRDCLDGRTPAVVATCSRDGIPNVTFLSHACYVDAKHLALSFQFFSKTRHNVLENPKARLLLWHPSTARMVRVDLVYEQTLTSGPVFERMRAMLAGLASQAGMEDVFRLRGSDVYRVVALAEVPGRRIAVPDARARLSPASERLAALRVASSELCAAGDLEQLLERGLAAVERHFGVRHAMVLVLDESRRCLTAVAARGYEAASAGTEVPLGQGVIGVAAEQRTAIRISHVTSDRAYVNAARAALQGRGELPPAEIPWPGLADPGSQLALPLVGRGALFGVLFAESPDCGRFDHHDEDALASFASHLGSLAVDLSQPSEEAPAAAVVPTGLSGRPAVLKRYREDDSVFLDDQYVIKGVAGAILWAMASDHQRTGRVVFTNRELRLDPRIPLPQLGDNLEARLCCFSAGWSSATPAYGSSERGAGSSACASRGPSSSSRSRPSQPPAGTLKSS
jgi:adenylate cyclase